MTGPHQYEAVVGEVHKVVPPLHDPFVDLVPPEGIRLTPRHYAYLKISEGCNNACSFCIIPDIRGRLASRPAASVMAEAERLVAAGVKELLVISQDTSAYGLDIKYQTSPWKGAPLAARFLDLATALGTLGAWVRLHYVYPYPHVDGVIPLMAEGKILPYLDIPFQHASPKVLKAMRRPAHGEKTLERIESWRRDCPDLAIRSTFIVGFPGETEEDFVALLDWLREARINRLGCFKYENVDGAKANALEGHVPDEVKEERLPPADDFAAGDQRIAPRREGRPEHRRADRRGGRGGRHRPVRRGMRRRSMGLSSSMGFPAPSPAISSRPGSSRPRNTIWWRSRYEPRDGRTRDRAADPAAGETAGARAPLGPQGGARPHQATHGTDGAACRRALAEAAERITICPTCGNADTVSPCTVCRDPARDGSMIVVVEEVGDLWALERAGVVKGRYHVLGGHLSPLDGIRAEDLNIAGLMQRTADPSVKEIILALNATVEGQTTAHFLADELKRDGMQITRLAHGVPVGGELDYLDEGTLAAAIKSRRPA